MIGFIPLKYYYLFHCYIIGIEIKYFYTKLNEIKGLLTHELVERKGDAIISLMG